MRGRDAIAMSVAALAVTAAFVIVSAPLPGERSVASGTGGGFVVVTADGTAEAVGPVRDCPSLADLFSPDS